MTPARLGRSNLKFDAEVRSKSLCECSASCEVIAPLMATHLESNQLLEIGPIKPSRSAAGRPEHMHEFKLYLSLM